MKTATRHTTRSLHKFSHSLRSITTWLCRKGLLISVLLGIQSTTANAGTEWKRILLKQSATATVINVPTGKILESTTMVAQTTNPTYVFSLDYGNGDVISRSDFALLGQPGNSILTNSSIPPGLFVGPLSLSLRLSSGSGLVVIQYRLLDNPSTPVAISSGLVIPPSTPSSVTVSLEESTDLITWTSIFNSDYLPSNGSKFFRMNAAQK